MNFLSVCMNFTEFYPLNFILKHGSLILSLASLHEIAVTETLVGLNSLLFGVRISSRPSFPFNIYLNIVHVILIVEHLEGLVLNLTAF